MKHKYHYDDEYVLDLSSRIHSVISNFDQLFARFDSIVDAMEKALGDDYATNIRYISFLQADKLPINITSGWFLLYYYKV